MAISAHPPNPANGPSWMPPTTGANQRSGGSSINGGLAGPPPTASRPLSAAAPPHRGGAGGITRPSIQGKSPRQNSSVAKRHRCSTCQIEYEVLNNQAARCPLCDVQRRLDATQLALQSESNKNRMLTERLQRLAADNDVSESMRQAVSLCDERDMAFLKQVAYRWRAASTFRLTVVHVQRKFGRRQMAVANGFLLMDRGAEPETHECSSIGGSAMASEYENACRMWSNIKAMELMLRVLAPHMTGRTQ